MEMELWKKKKNIDMGKELRVRNIDLYVTVESHPIKIKKKNYLEYDFSQTWMDKHLKNLDVRERESFPLYIKYMRFLSNRRKRENEIIF